LIPKIPRFRRLGKGGEHQIASILGDLALISYPEFDVGFDFFCELFENNKPSGKFFWVQAKTTKKFNECWKKHIDKKTIALWLKQLYPVFIIIYEKSSDKIYWASVEDKRRVWERKLSDKSKTIEVVINRTNELQKNNQNLEFVRSVKGDTVLAHAVHGIPQMIGEGYVKIIPVLRLSEIARMNIRHRIRLGFDYLMYDAWLRSDLEEAYNLGKQLATFDKNHYDHFIYLARICYQLGRDDEAIKNYDSAIEICKRDTNWNKRKKATDASIEEIIESIEKEKKRKFPRKSKS
jgi:tetratricopeptide (TPR) repeat protein